MPTPRLISQVPAASFIEIAKDRLEEIPDPMRDKIRKELHSASADDAEDDRFFQGYLLGIVTAAVLVRFMPPREDM